MDIYSHVLPGLQEAAARRFDEGLENTLTEAQVAEVLEKNVGKVALRSCFKVKFKAGGVSEWSMVPLLKSGVPQGTVGSNPTSSATSEAQ